MQHILAIVCYWLGLDLLFYWLNRRSKRVLTFHHVIPEEFLPISEESCICFSDKKFCRILDVISAKYRFSNDLSDCSTCTVTFDDGYLNQYEIAGRILQQRNTPAILFLASSLENSTQALAVDRHIAWAQQVPLEIAEKFFGRSFASREELWALGVRPLFANDGAGRGEHSLKKLDECWPVVEAYKKYTSEYFRLRFTGVSTENLKELETEGWMIYHHTYTHFPVSDLTEDEARNEIIPPEEKNKLPFSFPYGDLGSVSSKDIQLAEQLGYPLAFANGVNYSPLTGRFFFPRFMFYTDDKYDIHFQLSGLKYFLKYHRLLPVL